eukprot:Ihof_evm9s233 gene=Ihof_evmTU9s233
MISRDLLITMDTLRTEPHFSELVEAVEGLEDETLFALFLLYQVQMGHQSSWYAFLTAVRACDWWKLSPIQWGNDEVRLLRGSPLYVSTLETVDSIQDLLEQLGPALDEGFSGLFPQGCPDIDDFLWALSVVDTCGRTIQLNDGEGLCLIPIEISPRYHPYAPIMSSYDVYADAYAMKSLVDLQEGDEVFTSFGSRDLSNEELLI